MTTNILLLCVIFSSIAVSICMIKFFNGIYNFKKIVFSFLMLLLTQIIVIGIVFSSRIIISDIFIDIFDLIFIYGINVENNLFTFKFIGFYKYFCIDKYKDVDLIKIKISWKK